MDKKEAHINDDAIKELASELEVAFSMLKPS